MAAKTIIGTVSSDKADKTITVTVVTRKTHPLYKKQYSVGKKFMAHDEKNEAKVGDKVAIIETRPLSARKRYVLKEIVDRPAIRESEVAKDAAAPEVEAPAEAVEAQGEAA
jgi:small subunit ribosomal protein S17